MESSTFTNRPNYLGGETRDNTSSTAQQGSDTPRYTTRVSLSPEIFTRDHESYDFTNAPDVSGSFPAVDHDLAARAAVSAQTEIGNPKGPIPTSIDTKRQLAAVQASELPVGASRTATGPPGFSNAGSYHAHYADYPQSSTDASESDRLREQRDSNYAPGYRKASEAVPQRTYSSVGHDAVSFPHEQLGPAAAEESGRDDAPSELPPMTQGRDYALLSSPGDIIPAAVPAASVSVGTASNTEGRRSPGASLGSKIRGAFAQVHGATEIVRGNMRAAIDNAVGDEARKMEDEDILRQGQREYTTRKLEK